MNGKKLIVGDFLDYSGTSFISDGKQGFVTSYKSLIGGGPISQMFNIFLYFSSEKDFVKYVKKVDTKVNILTLDEFVRLKTLLIENNKDKLLVEFDFLSEDQIKHCTIWDNNDFIWKTRFSVAWMNSDGFRDIYDLWFRYIFTKFIERDYVDKYGEDIVKLVKDYFKGLVYFVDSDAYPLPDKEITRDKIYDVIKLSYREFRKDTELMNNLFDHYKQNKLPFYFNLIDSVVDDHKQSLANYVSEMYFKSIEKFDNIFDKTDTATGFISECEGM